MGSRKKDNEPKDEILYSRFGQILLDMVLHDLPEYTPKIAQEASLHLSTHPGFPDRGFHESAVASWLRGSIDRNKPLTFDNFEIIVQYFLGKPGLRSVSAVERFARLGRPDYISVMKQDWFNQLGVERDIPQRSRVDLPSHITPIPGTAIARPELVQNIIRRVEPAMISNNLLIFHGPDGIGKETTFKQMAQDEEIQLVFQDIEWFISPKNEPENWYEYWHKLIVHQKPENPEDHSGVRKTLRRHLDFPTLYFVEDCIYPEMAQSLRDCISNDSLIIVGTSKAPVARKLDPTSEITVQIPVFSKDEVEIYYEQNYGEITEENRKYLFHLAKLCRYLPMELKLSLARIRKSGWDHEIRLLKSPPVDTAECGTHELFEQISRSFHSLTAAQQDRLLSIATLPQFRLYDVSTFHAFWGQEIFQAQEFLVAIEEDTLLIESVKTQSGKMNWIISEKVRGYLKCMYFSRLNREPIEVYGWAEKVVNINNILEDTMKDLPGIGKRILVAMKGRRGLVIRPRQNVLIRVIRSFFGKDYNSDWEMVELYEALLTSEQFIMALYLFKREKRFMNLIKAYLLILFGILPVFQIILIRVMRDNELMLRFLKSSDEIAVIIWITLLLYFLFFLVFKAPKYELAWVEIWKTVTGEE